MGIQSLTSGLDVKEGAEPNYAVYLLRGEVFVKDMYLISTTNGRMFTNIAESILGDPAIWPGGRPTGGRCERHAACRHGTLIGRLVSGVQPDVDIWGHSVLLAILGHSYPPR